MIKLVKGEERKKVYLMEMKPLQVGRIILNKLHGGHVVMRTASTSHFEVMNLTDPGEDVCWTSENEIQVELFEPGKKVIFEIFNEKEED
jgi:hypothetical protein